MATTVLSSMEETATRCDTPESTLSNTTAEAESSNAQSSSSTPPTSVAGSTSVSSPSAKLDAPVLSIFDTVPIIDVDDDDYPIEESQSSNGRPRRARKSTLTSLKLFELGLATSVPKDTQTIRAEALTRRRTISGDTLIGSYGGDAEASTEATTKEGGSLVQGAIEALDLQLPAKKLSKSRGTKSLGEKSSQGTKGNHAAKEEAGKRRSLRSADEPVESLTKKLSVLGKRGAGAIEETSSKIKRELRRLADTNEFAKIETKPVIHEVWSCGKLVTGNEPPKKKAKVEAPKEKVKEPEPEVVEEKPKVKKEKKWLNKGLYAGQEAIVDLSQGYTAKERRAMAKANADVKRRSILPLPLWMGQRLLLNGRDFKLPFDVCCPLPPGQPKPDEWKKTTRNRFVGDAAALWKKSKHFSDFNSRCVCSKESGCDENCYNRMMLYECDDENCPIGSEFCNNRAFADLHERRAKGGKYRVGVEVIKTEDRGYGVRSNRCFAAGQIIVEYTGEIITEPECQRRMTEDYKDNDCYYLMLFDQNMIIDATRGSIARFVNHSCEPNCEMVKWIVGGKPHMALFAGKKPIMTGDELTYDYKFDPFSSRNVQECRCGSKSCRGVLGPKPKEAKQAKSLSEGVSKAVKGAVNAGKRKLKELLNGGTDQAEITKTKKRKVSVPVGKSKSTKALHAAMSLARKVAKVGTSGDFAVLKKSSKKVEVTKGLKQAKLSYKNSSLTVVPHTDGRRQKPKKETLKNPGKKNVKVVQKRTLKPVKKSVVKMAPKKQVRKGTPKKAAAPKAGSAKKASDKKAAPIKNIGAVEGGGEEAH